MKFDGKTMDPHAEVQRIFRGMRTLTVGCGKKKFNGTLDITSDGEGNVLIAYREAKPAPTPKARPKPTLVTLGDATDEKGE